jgi:hypothetical protein
VIIEWVRQKPWKAPVVAGDNASIERAIAKSRATIREEDLLSPAPFEQRMRQREEEVQTSSAFNYRQRRTRVPEQAAMRSRRSLL